MSETVTRFLWFYEKAEDAAIFYVSVLRSCRIPTTRNTESAPGQAGSALTVEIEREGQRFIALNGGPDFSFTPPYYSSRLSADGGRPSQCGWLQEQVQDSMAGYSRNAASLIKGPKQSEGRRGLASDDHNVET